jgi:hypothetical protein
LGETPEGTRLAPLDHPARERAAAEWDRVAEELRGDVEAAAYAREKAARIRDGRTPVFSDTVE